MRVSLKWLQDYVDVTVSAEELGRLLTMAGIEVDAIDVIYELDMHYLGQTHTISVPLPVTLQGDSTGVTAALVREAFEQAYQTSFSRLLPGLAIRIVTLRTAAIGRRPAFDLASLAPREGTTLDSARREPRQVWFGGAWHETSVWSRLDLPVGTVIKGPAILEQADATTVVDPHLSARVDAFGNVVIERTV